MTKESWEELCDIWGIVIKAATAFCVSFAIVYGACCGLKAAGATFPKAGIEKPNTTGEVSDEHQRQKA